MRKITKRDVDEAWQAWAAAEMARPLRDGEPAGGGLSPLAAIRLIAHLRFSSAFCDYVLQNEPERIVEITGIDVMRAVTERQRDVEDWLEDWEILPDSVAKEYSRWQLAHSHRVRMELMCLRHLWLASQAKAEEFRMPGDSINSGLGNHGKPTDRPRRHRHIT